MDDHATALILPVCKKCGRVPANGMYDGIRLKGAFICTNCEKEIARTEVGAEDYQEVKAFIHSILFSRTGRQRLDAGV